MELRPCKIPCHYKSNTDRPSTAIKCVAYTSDDSHEGKEEKEECDDLGHILIY